MIRLRSFVLLLGGYVFRDILSGGYSKILSLADVIRQLREENIELAIVTGGSNLARAYIRAAKELGADNFTLDEVGILSTRLHALLIMSALSNYAYPKVITSYEEASIALSMNKIPIAGGMQPGQSTDAVASLMAEKLGFNFVVKMTSVNGVYDRDPHTYPDAKKIDELTYDELEDIVRSQSYHPGKYELLDALSIKILRRSSISTIILSGDTPRALLELVSGKRIGSLIKPR